MKLKLSERVVDYFIQALFIFVSVFLAFWLNNYQSKQEEIKSTQKAKQVIVAELEKNLEFLKRTGEQHRLIYMYQKDFFKNKVDTLKKYREIEIPHADKGFEKYFLTNNTLFLANDSRINLNTDNIVTLNRLSEQISQTQKSANQFSNRREIINKETEVREKYYIFYDFLNDLWLKEDDLIQNIESTIQSLN